MTTVFTPTIDVDLRSQPLVPRDPRRLEQVTPPGLQGRAAFCRKRQL